MRSWILLAVACAPEDPAGPGPADQPPPPDPSDPYEPPVGTHPTETPTGGTPTVPDDSIVVGGLVFHGQLPTNLLVVSVDTTRRDYLSYFSGSGLTPNLDAILNQSYVLADHRSCSNWTGPSMTCVVSGKTAGENGFWPGGSLPQEGFGPTAKLLGDIGFDSTVVTANGVYFADWCGTTWGFEKFIDYNFQPADVVADVSLAEIAILDQGPNPWYFHVHFIDPHGSYCPPYGYVDQAEVHDEVPITDCYEMYWNLWYLWYLEPVMQDYFLENVKLNYEGELSFWDTQFGEMWSDLDSRGVLDDTLVVFVTDHGEQFGEHGGFYHGTWLASEENRSTAAFWAKNLDPGVWDGVTIHQDVAATLQAVFGLTPPLPISGIVAGTGAADRVVISYNLGTTISAASHTRQLIYDWWGNKTLYHLDTDPTGTVNLYDPADPDVIDLWDELEPAIDDLITQFPWIGQPYNPGP